MQVMALTCGFARRCVPRTLDLPVSYDAHQRDARLSQVLNELVC
jgi:hypothetical protein